jgi:hypothetical protein
VEGRLVRFGLHRAETFHAAHVVDAVHDAFDLSRMWLSE